MEIFDITAVILAGGFGTRLRSVVSDRPKVLAKVGEKFFLTFLLDYLISFNFQHVVLCTGYLADHIYAELGEKYHSLRLTYSKEESPLGTGGAVRLAYPLFESDDVFIMNGDSFCGADIAAFRKWHSINNADISIVLTRVSDAKRFGNVTVGESQQILKFEEKNKHSGEGWINGGMYLLNKRLIQEIPVNISISLEKDIFPSWIGKNFYGFKSNSRFIDIGTPESYSEAENFFHNIFVNFNKE